MNVNIFGVEVSTPPMSIPPEFFALTLKFVCPKAFGTSSKLSTPLESIFGGTRKRCAYLLTFTTVKVIF